MASRAALTNPNLSAQHNLVSAETVPKTETLLPTTWRYRTYPKTKYSRFTLRNIFHQKPLISWELSAPLPENIGRDSK